jgi:hypothetical protein
MVMPIFQFTVGTCKPVCNPSEGDILSELHIKNKTGTHHGLAGSGDEDVTSNNKKGGRRERRDKGVTGSPAYL